MKNKESFCPLSGDESFKKDSPHHHQLLAPDYSRVSILTPNELGMNYFKLKEVSPSFKTNQGSKRFSRGTSREELMATN